MRAHLYGGVPYAEVAAKQELLHSHGLSLEAIFIPRVEKAETPYLVHLPQVQAAMPVLAEARTDYRVGGGKAELATSPYLDFAPHLAERRQLKAATGRAGPRTAVGSRFCGLVAGSRVAAA